MSILVRVPSLKEPVVSRAVSADFVVCVCPLVRLTRKPSTLSALAECCRGTSVFTDPLAAVLVNVHRPVAVLRLYLRGLFGRSFLHATVPQPVPSWTPADRWTRPRSGAIRPTPIKSVRSSCGTPRRSIIRNTPGPRARSRGHIELAWSRRDSHAEAANQHRHKSRSVSSHRAVLHRTLQEPGRRTGQRWEPTRAPRQGSKRNEGGPAVHPCSLASHGIPL